jgi:hypothetical protein
MPAKNMNSAKKNTKVPKKYKTDNSKKAAANAGEKTTKLEDYDAERS